MADILAEIVARKRIEVADRLGGVRIDAAPSTRSLRAALAQPGARFIMEVKRRSPSGHRSSATPGQAVAAYAPLADAISVLTDGPGFGGSLDDLRLVRRLFDGPILAKDFIVDVRQVAEARAAGADAILVMMSVLDQAAAASVLAEAERLRMDAIVEVHDEAELSRALALGASIVGINNRDLKSMTVDLNLTKRLSRLVPADVLVVSESGIGSRDDVVRLGRYADAFLVGSSLMAAPDIGEAVRALVHGRVKLCGLTRRSDVEAAARVGATHAGFILVPESPRSVGAAQAAVLAESARRPGLKSVAVLRHFAPAVIARLAHDAGLDAIQLHRQTDAKSVAELRSMLPATTEIWSVCGVEQAAAEPCPGADRTIFDAVHNGLSGGTGRTFDWGLLRRCPNLPSAFVAGGINPANAGPASMLGAYGIDVSSGVEAAPGIKDAAKVEALFAALRPAARSDA